MPQQERATKIRPDGRWGASQLRVDRRRVLTAAGAAVGSFTIGLSLTSDRAAAAQFDPGGILRWGSSSDVTGLDPIFSSATISLAVYSNIYDQLLRREPDLSLIPGLAEEWELVDDLTWQFRLRPGVTFHNGDPLTAEDVKFTFDRLVDPETQALHAAEWSIVESVEVVDDLTVNFTTTAPDPLLPARHTGRGMWILPKAYFEAVGPEEFNLKPVGTGPLKVVEWIPDDHITLEANADYWGGPPIMTGVDFRPRPEIAARVAALTAGDADLIDSITADQAAQIDENEGTKIASTLYAGLWELCLNARTPPLDNVLVRKALSLAIDRQAIIDELWLGQAEPVNGPIPQGDFAYNPELPPLPYDPERAMALLEEAGYAGENVIYESPRGALENDIELAEIITSMWTSVGVNASVEVIEPSVRAEKIRNQTLKGALLIPFTSTLLDPDGLMWRLLMPGSSYSYWDNEEFQALGAEARVSLDEELRRANYQRMVEIFLEYEPWILLFQPRLLYGVTDNLDFRPMGNYQLSLRTQALQVSP